MENAKKRGEKTFGRSNYVVKNSLSLRLSCKRGKPSGKVLQK